MDGTTPTLITLMLFCATAGMLFGYDTGVVSVAILQMKDEDAFEDFSTPKQEWFVSSTTLAAAGGTRHQHANTTSISSS